MYLNGEFTDGGANRTLTVVDPATEDPVCEIPYGDGAIASRALDAAAAALPTWRARTAHDRARLVRRVAELVRERADCIAEAMTREVGKPLAESRAEVLASADLFEWYAEEAKRADGRIAQSHWPEKRILVLREPVGVVATIAPWNFPVLLQSRKLAPALAVGCTVVARPASRTPLATMELFGCIHEAGLPPGVANLVTGPAEETADAFFAHPALRKVSFTGSTDVGRQLAARAASSVIRVSLELGGNAPVLVFPDVDPEAAARKCVAAKFRNMGQVCISPTRFYVHEAVVEEFTAHAVSIVSALRLGHGLAEGTDVGPLFEPGAAGWMEELLADATARGARVLCGGRRPEGAAFARGYWFLPTVTDRVTADSRLFREEVFGPIMSIAAFCDEEAAIAQANDTMYGLAAYVLTQDIDTAVRAAERLEAGIVGVNDMLPAAAEAPFGGMKQSGLGREGGPEGLDGYLETKYICLGLGPR